jgi:glycosyltransferase involved in cell wall biosynthesis
MAHGCIPVVSDIPANREWIVDHVNGLFVKDNLQEEALDIFNRKDEVAEYNRRLIAGKAIFPECMEKFISEVNKLVRRS